MFREIFEKIKNFEKCADVFFQKNKNYEKPTDKFIKKCKISKNV